MKQELNAFHEDKLLGTWEGFFVLDSPIYLPVKCIDSVEVSDGDMPSVVKCLKATYRLSEAHDITLSVIQDDTLESEKFIDDFIAYMSQIDCLK